MKRSLVFLVGLGVCSYTALAAADDIMPAPKVTQFHSAVGTAPIATGKSDDIENLPPVSDVNANTEQASSIAANNTVSSSYAAVPVTDTSLLSANEQLAVLKRQVNNLIERSAAGGISSIREQLEQINGKLAEEQNNLVNLQKKQNQFYQNLDQRISVLEQEKGKSGAVDTKVKIPPANTSLPVVKVTGKVTEDQAYQAAFSLISDNKYDQAQAALQSYISTFPDGKSRWDARYWSGEIYFLRKNYSQAEKMFSEVVANGSDQGRIPVCQLRLAKIYLSTNREAQAKQLLNLVKSKYPNTTESRLAVSYLKQIQS
jgi:tol-pal system protein YbgF